MNDSRAVTQERPSGLTEHQAVANQPPLEGNDGERYHREEQKGQGIFPPC